MFIFRFGDRYLGLLRQNVGTNRKAYFNCSSLEELFQELDTNLDKVGVMVSPYFKS